MHTSLLSLLYCVVRLLVELLRFVPGLHRSFNRTYPYIPISYYQNVVHRLLPVVKETGEVSW